MPSSRRARRDRGERSSSVAAALQLGQYSKAVDTRLSGLLVPVYVHHAHGCAGVLDDDGALGPRRPVVAGDILLGKLEGTLDAVAHELDVIGCTRGGPEGQLLVGALQPRRHALAHPVFR